MLVTILICLAFGIGFGFCVQRSGLCFAHGLGEIFIGRAKRIVRLFTVIFIITAIGFLVASLIDPGTGPKDPGHSLRMIGQIRGYGFYNLLAGMIFGAGIFLNGGCILGTLRQLGEGNLTFLVVFVSFIPGMALVVFVLNDILGPAYDVKGKLLPQMLNINNAADYWYVTAALVLACVVWFIAIGKRRTKA